MKLKIYPSVKKYFTFFVCYSIIGWLYEEFLWVFEEHQVVNRGFCLGPGSPYMVSEALFCTARYTDLRYRTIRIR